MAEWKYLRQGAMMLPADQMANPLGDTALTDAELLMREAIQNSADEKLKDASGPVKFVVRRLNLQDEEKRSLVEELHLAEFRDLLHVFILSRPVYAGL